MSTKKKMLLSTSANKKASLPKSMEANYASTISYLKKQIQESQLKAALSVNSELIKLYWKIGETIVDRQEKSGWGGAVIERLAKDLQNAFPGVEGFSRRNIFRMRSFFLAYQKVPQAVAQIEDFPIFCIPWGHNALLLEKIKDTSERLWYVNKVLEQGWSRAVLSHWIQADAYKRDGKATTNFNRTLPAPQSDVAQQTLKDPYIFDFLMLHEGYLEKELEEGLINHIQKFLIELGQGFAFVGKQVPLSVDRKDYYIDLLFYHLKLRSYVVIELKAKEFDPRDSGQISFYLSAVDDLFRHPLDNPTIGMILCKSKSKVTVEYALRNNSNPIGVSSYEIDIIKKLPKELKGSLPSVKEIESELEKEGS